MKKLVFTSSFLLVIITSMAQNVGIGIPSPQEKLEVNGNIKALNSTKGILLNTADAPIITRAWDPFLTGAYTGAGRWGLFMEPNRLTIGMPNIFGKAFNVSSFADNSTVAKTLFTVNQEGGVGVGIDPLLAKFQVYSDSVLFSVTPSGNVGIGSAIPVSKFEVKAREGQSTMRLVATDNTDILTVNSPFLYNSISIGGATPGTVSAVTISNEFTKAFTSSPQLRLAAVNDLPGNGANSIIRFDNLNATNNNYEFTAHTGANDALHSFTINHRNSISTIPVLYLSNNNNVGIGTTIANQKLTVNGAINSTSMAGAGNRPVQVNSSGTFFVPAATSSYYSAAAPAFVKLNTTSTDVLQYNVNASGGLAITTVGSSQPLIAPLYLPHGARVTAVKFFCYDNSAQNLTVQITSVEQISPSIFQYSSQSTSGVSTSVRLFSSVENFVIDNNLGAYTIRILPTAGSSWDGSNLYVKSVVIEYQL